MQALESRVRDFLFSAQGAPFEGVQPERMCIYRRLVRNNLMGAVLANFGLIEHLAGEEKLREWIADWLQSTGPKDRRYWMLPLEFASWFAQIHGESQLLFAEVIQWEALQLSCLNAPNDVGPGVDGFWLHPSARLGIYHYPVYLLDGSEVELPEKIGEPAFILLHRVDEQCKWLRLDPQVAQLLSQLAEGATLTEGLALLESMYGSIDRRSLRAQLIGLYHRGILHAQHGQSGFALE